MGAHGRADRLCCGAVRAVTFQAPGEVRLEERPDPEPIAADDAVVRVEATGICGSDLHIYHGRVAIEPGLRDRPRVRGHRASPPATRSARSRSATGSWGPTAPPAARCFHCRRGEYHKCDGGRVFGHGATLGSLQGAQADLVLVPNANLTLRRVPDGLSERGRALRRRRGRDRLPRDLRRCRAPEPLEPGATVAVLGLGPVGLCAVQVAKASGRLAGRRGRHRRGAAADGASRSAPPRST